MSRETSPQFYVSLKDDFQDRLEEAELPYLFPEIEDPYLSAKTRLTPGRVYPVLRVAEEGRALSVLDDRGRIMTAATALFKFASE